MFPEEEYIREDVRVQDVDVDEVRRQLGGRILGKAVGSLPSTRLTEMLPGCWHIPDDAHPLIADFPRVGLTMLLNAR